MRMYLGKEDINMPLTILNPTSISVFTGTQPSGSWHILWPMDNLCEHATGANVSEDKEDFMMAAFIQHI